jgi:hypothetical protein
MTSLEKGNRLPNYEEYIISIFMKWKLLKQTDQRVVRALHIAQMSIPSTEKIDMPDTHQIAEIVSYYRLRKNQLFGKRSPNIVDLARLFQLNTLYPFHLDDFTVTHDSKIHGLGVFAKKHIPKNTVVTFYPTCGFFSVTQS